MPRSLPFLAAALLLLSLAAPAAAFHPPAPPQGLTAAAEGSFIRLSWTPRDNASADVMMHVVYLVEDGWRTHVANASAEATEYVDGPLPAGATRTYVVTAMGHDWWESEPSEPATATVPAPPGAPQGLAVAAGARSLALSWSPPASDGGAPVTHYLIHGGESPGDLATIGHVNASSTAFTDAPLPDGATRHYRVTALNDAGEGPASDLATGTTYGAPSAPRGLSATVLGTTVRLAWSAPAMPNASSEHRVYRDAGNGPVLVATLPASQLSWDDASPPRQASLTYVVRAANVAGEGAASNAAGAFVPDVPSAPRNLAASGTAKSITLRWDAPASDGGSALLAYRIYRSAGGGASTLLAEQPAGDRDYVDTACPRNATCAYRVAATNAMGEGAPSNWATRP